VPEAIDQPAIQRVRDVAARKGVSLEITVFDESTHTAAEAAAAVGVELGQIVKSLVFVHPSEEGGLTPVLCLVSGSNRVDVARLAAVTGEPEIRRATAREAHELTGFSIGGIPPFASRWSGLRRAAPRPSSPSRREPCEPWPTPMQRRSPSNGRRSSRRRSSRRSPRHRSRPRAAPADSRRTRSRPIPFRRTEPSMTGEAHDAVTSFPGGVRLRARWGGSGSAQAVFALTEAGGELTDHGSLVDPDPDALCRAELHVDTPAGSWTTRLASTIFDEPRAVAWDTAGLLVVSYGFHTYGFVTRFGSLAWSHRSRTPIVKLLASSRLEHVLVQTELETFSIRADGEVAWRLGHSDVVTGADLVGGRLVLSSYDGVLTALDPVSGRNAG
jgi:prolyl-tRNA editing enzyme YbaK/EbsC (Cys-tRNA(Pro) deacylase)